MKLHIDKEPDALHLRLDHSAIVESEEVAPGVVLDYNEANHPAAIEILGAAHRRDNPESRKQIVFETSTSRVYVS